MLDGRKKSENMTKHPLTGRTDYTEDIMGLADMGKKKWKLFNIIDKIQQLFRLVKWSI